MDNQPIRGSRLEAARDKPKKHQQWLWPDYLQLNKLVHFAGASSQGKSPVTLDLIARVTAGSDWPDGTTNECGPMSAILLASEDDWSDTIIPRLELAGANTELVFEFVSTITRGDEVHDVSTTLDKDIEELRNKIKERDDVGLVVIDPITNYLGSKKMNQEDDMRSILMPLSSLAQELNVCIVTVGHLNKKGNEAPLLQRLMGAAAFGGVARQVFMFGDDPEENNKFAHVMGFGRGTTTHPLKYKTESVPVEWDGKTSEVVRIKWCGVSNVLDMDDVINPPKQREKTTTEEAADFIKAFLRDGAKPTKSIVDALTDAGIELNNWQKAARKVAKSRQIKGKQHAGFEWYLATPEQEPFDYTKKEVIQ
jgi:putative DNA primase/helicase